MELNKEHRAALLNELEKAQEAKDLNTRCMNNDKDADLIPWREVEDFLIKARIELIKKALTDNELYNY